jgi:hypothetical protein
MANNACEQAAAQPEWLTKQTAGKGEAEQKIWTSAYDKVHSENHYEKGEGPAQALDRLKKDGFLTNMSISDLSKEAHNLEQKEATKEGKEPPIFSTHEQILSAQREKEEVGRYVESMKKSDQANRLTPSCENFKSALSPDLTEKLKAAGLETDPQALHDKMVKRLSEDKHLSSQHMEHMKGFPVGAEYVATGAVNGAQMDHLMREQRALRQTKHEDKSFQELKASNPEEYKKEWTQYIKDTDVGKLLSVHSKEDPRHFNIAKIEAANSLIAPLKELQKQQS